VGTSQVLGP